MVWPTLGSKKAKEQNRTEQWYLHRHHRLADNCHNFPVKISDKQPGMQHLIVTCALVLRLFSHNVSVQHLDHHG